MSDELVDRIHRVRFTPVRLREGYDMGEVDRLLDSLEEAVRRQAPLRPLVDAAVFTPTRLREGYDMGDVDRFLATLVRDSETAAQSAPATPYAPPDTAGPATRATPAAPPTPAPTVIQEQHGLLARLLGRK